MNVSKNASKRICTFVQILSENGRKWHKTAHLKHVKKTRISSSRTSMKNSAATRLQSYHDKYNKRGEIITMEPIKNVENIGTLVSFLPREIALPIITESDITLPIVTEADLTLPIITESDISSMFLEAEKRLLSLGPSRVDIMVSSRNEEYDIMPDVLSSAETDRYIQNMKLVQHQSELLSLNPTGIDLLIANNGQHVQFENFSVPAETVNSIMSTRK